MAIPRDAKGLSAVCDCGISRSYSLFLTVRQHRPKFRCGSRHIDRRMAENGFAPPLGNVSDIFYLVENKKPSLLRDVCTLCSGALVCKSL